MKKTLSSEDIDIDDRTYSFFDLPEFGALSPAGTVASRPTAIERNAHILDKMLSGIKWTFLYVPGVLAMHMVMLGFAFFSFFHHDWGPEILLGAVGAGIIYSFMIMLGIGKLSDLRYLSVVGAVATSSLIATILYSILIVLFRGEFFGSFLLMTMLIPLVSGILIKRKTDRLLDAA